MKPKRRRYTIKAIVLPTPHSCNTLLFIIYITSSIPLFLIAIKNCTDTKHKKTPLNAELQNLPGGLSSLLFSKCPTKDYCQKLLYYVKVLYKKSEKKKKEEKHA